MTAFLDRISQLLTTSPLWIQSPIVILGSVVVCALLAVLLLRVVDILGAWVQRIGTPQYSGKGQEPHHG
ncbi:hypothetical protein ACMG4H_10615 [Corynebacterium glutamicum]|uniref:Mechanosensitive ion channel protein MscS n=1 Tax=Corynebacterium glutamicum (strain R) TaxID=340322 RepID=A0AB72VCD6_CORGB|nr:hypothetical protein [Corynebacterium glutamicum]BAF55174.1 hypothetical protein cgR_2172 [Corynebacterium glutamicum R]